LAPTARSRRHSGALIASAVFALLVVATVGAFFVTTRLKRSAPVVNNLTFARYLSPNGDGRRDFVDIALRIRRPDEVTVSIVDKAGNDAVTLLRDARLARGLHRFRWDGRLSSGAVAPDGQYRLRVGLRHQARTLTSPRKLFVDTKPPRPIVRYVSPDAISPDGAGTANHAILRFDGPSRRRPTLLVFHSRLGTLRLVARRRGHSDSQLLRWDGRVGLRGSRSRAPSGNYLMMVRTRDAAGNVGPPRPPTRVRVLGHPGLRVRYIEARGPLRPVRAGDRVAFVVSSDRRRYRWRVRRLGSSRILQRGSSRSRDLTLHAPRGRTGVYLLDLRVGQHRYQTPFAVQSQRRSRLLVVLPAITWQGRNDLDANGDGFGDLLPEDESVALLRPFTGKGLPPAFGAREAPLLIALDREHQRYDLTTDVALAGGTSRQVLGRRGLLFAGPPRLYSLAVGRLVRSYVRAGGRVAWLGTEGFTQPVKLAGDRLETLPAPSARRNAFGERLRPRVRDAALTVLGDRIDFFAGAGDVFGPFPALEPSEQPGPGDRLLAAAGNEADRPSVAVYRQGKGIVARVGVDGFARSALQSPVVARIMRRLWTLLSQ
jgi:N,N-dimethylformamidase beta subunit-like protein/flagellar hook capping protein FlgD